jgi:hypothetical protein
MISSSKNKARDGFINDFDSLVDHFQTPVELSDLMGPLVVVHRPLDPFALDLRLDHTAFTAASISE